jgi:hypothetical protein
MGLYFAYEWCILSCGFGSSSYHLLAGMDARRSGLDLAHGLFIAHWSSCFCTLICGSHESDIALHCTVLQNRRRAGLLNRRISAPLTLD